MFSTQQAHRSFSNEKNLNRDSATRIHNLKMLCERSLVSDDGKIIYKAAPPGSGSASFQEMVAIIIMTATRELNWKVSDGRSETFHAPAGTILLVPADHQIDMTWSVQKEHMIVTLDADTVAKAYGGEEHLLPEDFFPKSARYVDTKCLQVAQLMRAEIQKNAPINENYLDALRTVFIGLLIQNHSHILNKGERRETGGLSFHSARMIESYIRENFMRRIAISDMAAHLGISAGHFLTSFRETFGQTPHQYLLMLRLNEVERQLRETNASLAEIADAVGFSSQSHMTTALKKNRNTTPGEVRRSRIADDNREKMSLAEKERRDRYSW